MPEKKIVVLAAVNGGAQLDRDGARVPVTPAEIADAAFDCYKAGASVVHIHARGEDKKATADVKVFGEIISRIREKCDILIQTTNGIGIRRDPVTGRLSWPPDEERLGMLRIEPRQDLFSIAGGTWDFYHPGGGWPDQTVPFVNTEELLRQNIPAAIARGAAIELEIPDMNFLHPLRRLADQGVFDPHGKGFWLNYAFGAGGNPPTARAITYTVDEGARCFPGAIWEIMGVDRDQIKINTIGLLMGADVVRVGFEDSIYLPDGRVAEHNHQMVETMVSIGRQFGREPTTVVEAKAVFGLA